MEINSSLLQAFYIVERGQIYAGDIFAKDKSPHKALIYTVVEDVVYAFAITSQEDFVERMRRKYGKETVVELPNEYRDILYPGSKKKSYININYNNCSEIDKDVFFQELGSGHLRRYDVTVDSENFLKAIEEGIKKSILYPPIVLEKMGLD